MVLSIHQPAYLPWLGYFHKIAVSDTFVYFNKTQFEKGSYINRNRLNGPNGPFWVTVPIQKTNEFNTNIINCVKIDNKHNWAKKHWYSIKQNYQKTTYWNYYGPKIEAILMGQTWEFLDALCWEVLLFLIEALKIKTEIIRSIDLPDFDSLKSELILDICKHLNASTYFSGKLGKNYLDEKKYWDNSIKINYQNYNHPIYDQTYEYHENLSVLDLLFHQGPESLNIILKNNLTYIDLKNMESL